MLDAVRPFVEAIPEIAAESSILATLSDMVNPAEHASSNEVQKSAVRLMINEFAKNLRNISGKCMDVGCGPGDITNNILLPSLDPNAVIIGTDISVAMIEYAKKTYGDKERLEFEILDIQTKNLPEKYISKFDHIFSFHTFQWCDEIRKAFENLYCMLQSGGTILVLFPQPRDSVFEVFKILEQDMRFAPYMQNHKKYISPFYNSVLPSEELKDLLESIGFNVQHCSLREIDYSEIKTDTFISSVMSVSSFLDAMPLNRKEEFKAEFSRAYKLYGNKQCNNKERSILDLHKVLIVYAQKNVQ